MATFKIPTGETVVVDDEDFEQVSQMAWHRTGKGYVAHCYYDCGNVRSTYLHHFILGIKKVDHKDGDRLNNRRQNLRCATGSQNAGNKRKSSRPKSSRFKGVYWHKQRGQWRVSVANPQQFLGAFTDEAEAAAVYDRAARARWGEFACLNFPKAGERSAIDGHIVCGDQNSL